MYRTLATLTFAVLTYPTATLAHSNTTELTHFVVEADHILTIAGVLLACGITLGTLLRKKKSEHSK